MFGLRSREGVEGKRRGKAAEVGRGDRRVEELSSGMGWICGHNTVRCITEMLEIPGASRNTRLDRAIPKGIRFVFSMLLRSACKASTTIEA